MVEDDETPSVYSELADPALLQKAVFVIMLDFTAPWNFIQEFQKWVKFINELQQMAKLPIGELEDMAQSSTPPVTQPKTTTNSSRNQSSTKTANSSTHLLMQNPTGLRGRRRRRAVGSSLARGSAN